MNRIKRTVFLLLFCISVSLVQTGQAADLIKQIAAESTIEQIAQRGTIRVGMDIFEPWAMKNKKGELIGFEIDVARKFAQDMGVEIEFVPTKWSGIIGSLVAGKFDVIIGGMAVMPKRNLQINFSSPYYYTMQGVLANRKKAEGFTLADFNKPDVMIAARLGSTAAEAARKAFPKARLRLFDDEPSAVQEVQNGRVHAMVSDQPLPKNKAAESPEVFIAFNEALMKEPIGFGLRKGDVDTLNYFNNWIELVRSRGWIEERYHYWFETTAWKADL
ncbi:MAG: amino acid ABC transporter substrate-binding protein [Desulfobulbus propionicus]|nr:MAG: amino acid ABC transporter substrate-binding protein [Desulfobulbus propionicus]